MKNNLNMKWFLIFLLKLLYLPSFILSLHNKGEIVVSFKYEKSCRVPHILRIAALNYFSEYFELIRNFLSFQFSNFLKFISESVCVGFHIRWKSWVLYFHFWDIFRDPSASFQLFKHQLHEKSKIHYILLEIEMNLLIQQL